MGKELNSRKLTTMLSIQSKRLALLTVAAVLLASCSYLPSRTILHGMHAGKHKFLQAHDDQLKVWFVESTANGLNTVPVVRHKTSGADDLQQAVKELLDGPTHAEEKRGLGTEIPRGTVLISIERNGSAIELNLSKRFALSGGTTSFETRLQQLQKTVAQAERHANVYLDVEGKRLNIEEGEGIEIPQPINRLASNAEPVL